MGPGEDGAKSSLGETRAKPKPAVTSPKRRPPTRRESGGPQPPLPLVENHTVIARVRQDEQQGLVERYTRAAVKFIQANPDKPFFLYLAHNAVHFPIYPGKKWAGQNPNGNYSDWVEEVDWSVGQVLDTVRALHLDARTFVLFTSDNGGTTRAVNAPLRGFKGSTWEGGMREPTIAWWPGQIPAGTSSDGIAGMFDVLPTFVHLAGGDVPTDHKLDGEDIWPMLAGEPGAKSPHDVFYFYNGLKLEAVRSGPWKLRLGTAKQSLGKKTKEPDTAEAAALSQDQLYNLDTDIGESKNVADANPAEVARLHALADAMKSDLGLNNVGPGVRPLGRVAYPQPLIGKDGKIREGFAPK